MHAIRRYCFFGLYQILTLFLFPFFLLFLVGCWILQPAYRRNMMQRFGGYPSGFFRPLKGKKIFWIHAASVGEVMMSRLFIRGLRARYPDAGLVLSTITPTGRAAAKKHLEVIDLLIYFPFDFFWITQSVVKTVSPSLFIFMETEIWPNFLKSLSAQQIPSVMVNGRISPKSFPRYRQVRPFLSLVLDAISLFLMQSKQDAARIIALGAPPNRVEETGNMKYDQAISGDIKTKESTQTLEGMGLCEGALLMIAGSTRPGEEEEILSAYQIALLEIPSLQLVIAPRHLNRLDAVEKLVAVRGYLPVRKSKIIGPLQKMTASLKPVILPVILIDTLGELGQIYPLGRFIFVGGSLAPFGGHNLLEPAASRKPVFFGPHVDNFKEIASQLLFSDGGIEVADGKALAEKIVLLSRQPETYEKKAQAAYDVVLRHRGAVQRNLDRVASLACGIGSIRDR